MIACDFFTVDTVLLKRIYVHPPCPPGRRHRTSDRRLGEPTGPRLLIDAEHRVDRLRFLLHDRDSKFTAAFDAVFTALGIEMFRTPPHAPRANGLAERCIGTVAASAPTGYRSGATGICAWCWTSTFCHYDHHHPYR